MIWLRLLKVFLRGLRPVSASLHSISCDLHAMRRVAELRLRLEHNEILPDEKMQASAKVKDADLTELSWDVREAPIDPETGKPMVELEDRIDWESIFGRRKD